jgi:16S rRNA (adenine1518-N6/adenine1519-N6)-dimethyltransferase
MNKKALPNSVRAKKFLGQHFLRDENVAQKIADITNDIEVDCIVEIGPGMGVLTKYLLQKETPVEVVELDRESVAFLSKHFKELNGKIHPADFLKLDLATYFPYKSMAIVGNFPYNISSQILFKVLENKSLIPFFGGMFQKEVAQRIAAEPGSKTYGILSVLTQAFYEVEYLFTVSPQVFDPPPKVDSGVIKMHRKADFSLPVDEKLFIKVVKTGFNQRRKTLRNSLKSFNLPEKLREDIIFAQRPEQLHYTDFIRLTQLISEQIK